MKAVASERPRANILAVKKEACSIMKSTSIEFQGERFTLSDEMKECFLKLSDMVPDVPRNASGNIDGTVLMQYVIDYILDLELQLDGQGPFFLTAARHMDREPLAESSVDNIVVTTAQMPCSPPSPHTTDCEIRPPSK